MNYIKEYAKLAVTKGVNVQKGQTMILNTNIQALDLAHEITRAAYEQGAKEVVINYVDDVATRLGFEYQDIETLTTIPDWKIDSRLEYFKEGACILHLISDLPNSLQGIDSAKISARQLAMAKKSTEMQNYTMLNKVQWNIVAAANPAWAKQVFPNLEEDEAVDKLWEAIFKSTYVWGIDDPIAYWENRDSLFMERSKKMNDYAFESLHFTNGLGTDLVVGLVENHIWEGGSSVAENGARFFPNMPTEEIFTMPSKFNVQGHVVASKPLDLNGTLIEEFDITFKDGKAVEYHAKKNVDTLKELINFDEGSCYLGEVALVEHSSAISQSGILFYNTLFDENASCHLALGRAYPSNIKDGASIDIKEMDKLGMNHSMTHVDFMFGTSDMSVVGTTKDGKEIQVFKDGEFVI